MAAVKTSEQLERDIFGGSDSELSSDENDNYNEKPSQSRDAHDSSGGESDNYADSRPRSKKPRSRKATDGERAQRKRKRKAPPVEPNFAEMSEDEARRVRLEMKLDSIIKPKKFSRPKKRKNNEEILDNFADNEVARLREAMNNAADKDEQENREKRPATFKLRLLPEAMETLRKASLAQSMIDNNLLEAVKRWLEPLPDCSLPGLTIQREIFPLLKRMEFIDSAVLRESGLGRIVLFYTKCKRVTADIRKIAEYLMETWSRPIIKRSASYRDRVVPVAADRAEDPRVEKLNTIIARAKLNEKGRVRMNAVMIPQRELGNYSVAPKSNGGIMRGNTSVDNDIERRRRNMDRMRALTRKVSSKP